MYQMAFKSKLDTGVHHVVMKAPLTHKSSFAVIEVYEDRMEMRGYGAEDSRTLLYPPNHHPAAKL